MRYKLEGSWREGLAFDLHTVESIYLGVDEFGHDRFENTRSEMGELLYQLKYRNDESAISKIIKLLKKLECIDTFDAIIPVPSSKKNRRFQPVEEIAKALGQDRDVDVLVGFLKKVSKQELKEIDSEEERQKILKNAISIAGDEDLEGMKVLLLDDLYRSGATLEACADLLYNEANVGDLCVLTMTKTRSNR